MAATTSRKSTALKPDGLLARLEADFPELSFVPGGRFSWHAGNGHVTYSVGSLSDARGTWAILHEIGHALLSHTDFKSDIELLQLEISAWAKAHELAKRYDITLDQDYIEDCLDSYRDWLHIRATCPTCYVRCLQADARTYQCHNCGTTWHVTRSRLCRPYRRKS